MLKTFILLYNKLVYYTLKGFVDIIFCVRYNTRYNVRYNEVGILIKPVN